MSFIGNIAALAATTPHLHLAPPPPPTTGTTLTRDPTWLQVEVCREFLRQSCKRDNTECKYAHPSSNVDIQNGKVTVCFDAFKDRCTRTTCKYFHAPAQMKADLEMRGKMSLMRQKSEQLALQNHHNSTAAAAHLALLQLQQQHQHNPLLNPAALFAQNAAAQPHLIQSNPTAAALAQYQQLLQQHQHQQQQTYHSQTPAAAAGAALVPPSVAVAAAAAAAAGAAVTSNNTPLVSTSPSSTSGVAIGAPHTVGGGAAVATQLVDPSLLASMQVGAGGVNNVNGVNLSPSSNNNNNVCSASPPPNSKAFHTIEVCREFSRGACTRSDEDCRFAHPEPHVSIDPSSNRVTICMDYVKSGGQMCPVEQGANNNNNSSNNSPSTPEKCKYFHPPSHILERFQNGAVMQQQQQQLAAAAQLAQQQANNNGQSPLFTFQSPLNIQQPNNNINKSSMIALPPITTHTGVNSLHHPAGLTHNTNQHVGVLAPVTPASVPGNVKLEPGVQQVLPASMGGSGAQLNAQYLQKLCNNPNDNNNYMQPAAAGIAINSSHKRKVFEDARTVANQAIVHSNPAAAATMLNPPGLTTALLPNNPNSFSFTSNPAALANCTPAAANGSMFPTYGKMLRLDSNGLNGTKMTSPAAAAVGVNAIGGLNAAAAAYSPYGTSPQQASPQAFFYNPLYQAQLSAAAAAAAANSSQGSLIPATSPAFIPNHGGAGMINGAHSPAIYASQIHNGRFAAFG
ncbi:uncharacterized protein LOC142338988 isoform X2 [Convolutriloba macropyga]|uniref:uncharacterized protein LOC142338988 isoform X2 n=1 Tax=Convolutriloba macropyga TaxID=536237 RepID=UPI003F526AA3